MDAAMAHEGPGLDKSNSKYGSGLDSPPAVRQSGPPKLRAGLGQASAPTQTVPLLAPSAGIG